MLGANVLKSSFYYYFYAPQHVSTTGYVNLARNCGRWSYWVYWELMEVVILQWTSFFYHVAVVWLVQWTRLKFGRNTHNPCNINPGTLSSPHPSIPLIQPPFHPRTSPRRYRKLAQCHQAKQAHRDRQRGDTTYSKHLVNLVYRKFGARWTWNS